MRDDGGRLPRHRPRRDWKPVAASVTRPRMSLVLQSFLPFPAQLPLGYSTCRPGRGYKESMRRCSVEWMCRRTGLTCCCCRRAPGFSVDNDEAGWSTLIGAAARPARRGDRARARAAATSAASSAPCSPPACRCVASIPTDFGSSPALAEKPSMSRPCPAHVVRHDPAAAKIADVVTAVRRQLCDEHVAIGKPGRTASFRGVLPAPRRAQLRRGSRPISASSRSASPRRSPPRPDLARRYARLTSMPRGRLPCSLSPSSPCCRSSVA